MECASLKAAHHFVGDGVSGTPRERDIDFMDESLTIHLTGFMMSTIWMRSVTLLLPCPEPVDLE